VPLVEQELATLPEHLSSPPLFTRVDATRSFMCMLCRLLFNPFVLFLSAIVLSVLLRYTDSDYLFGIFKLFLLKSFHEMMAMSAFYQNGLSFGE